MPTSEMHGLAAPPASVNACPKCGDIYEGTAHVCATPDDPGGSVLIMREARLAPAGYLGTKDEIQEELDSVARSMRQFHVKHPDQVMKECSAFSARLTELCVLLHRVENVDRRYTKLRTQQVQKFIEEVDRQFRIASRLVEIQRQDLELIK